MIGLIMLAASAVTTGIGLYNAAQENSELARLGSQAVDEQTLGNRADRYAQDAKFFTTLQQLTDAEAAILIDRQNQARERKKLLNIGLLVTGGLLMLLALFLLIYRRDRPRE